MIFQSTDQPAGVFPGAKYLPQTRVFMRATWDAFKVSKDPAVLRINLDQTLKAAEAAMLARRPLWLCWEELFQSDFVKRPEWPAFIAEHVAPAVRSIRNAHPALRLACWPAPWNKQRALEQEMLDAAEMSRQYFDAGIDRLFDVFTARFYIDTVSMGQVQFARLIDRFQIIHERFRLPVWPVITPFVPDREMLDQLTWEMIVDECVRRFECVIVWDAQKRNLSPELARRFDAVNRAAMTAHPTES